MSVTHIVLFQFKADADPAAVQAASNQLLDLKRTCVHPETKAPYVTSFEGGRNNSLEGKADGFTHGFVVHFASAADRAYYVEKDPAHAAVKAALKPLAEKVQVFDFTPDVF